MCHKPNDTSPPGQQADRSPLVRLISTDFDGTIHTDGAQPRIPLAFQEQVELWQAQGCKWVINTGRDMDSLQQALRECRPRVQPDYLVLVEREIYQRRNGGYVGCDDWNQRCTQAHYRLFRRVEADLPALVDWIQERFQADLYSDPWSPLCLIARSNPDADAILAHILHYCKGVPGLTVMRNDVYARLSHADFNKGSALLEIARQLNVPQQAIFAAGDHYNDLPMLTRSVAGWIVAPANAIPEVQQAVRQEGGYLSRQEGGQGVAEALDLLSQEGRLPEGFALATP